MDAEGAVWYVDVSNQRCVRVREGGEILATVDLDRGAFACALSRGTSPRLFVVAQVYVISAHRADRVIPRARTRRREALVKEARTRGRH